MHKLLPTSRAGCISVAAFMGIIATPLPALAATYTGSAPAVHMELKNAGVIVCSAYNTPATTAPVATGCPNGTFIEQLFDINWRQIGSNRTVTVGTPTTGEIRNTNPKFRAYENTASNNLVVNNLTDFVTTFDSGSAAIPNTPGDGNFRITCQFSHFSYDDPIVFPGQPGRAHLHMFYGNTKTNAHTTQSSLVNSGGGSCNGFELNRSAYWTPALLDGKGNAVIPETILIYYKSKITNSAQRMPQGLELIAGNTTSSSFTIDSAKNLFWSCGKNGSITNQRSTIPNCGNEPINATIYFQQCWDNKNLKYDKNRPHVFQLQSVTDVCPSNFPVRLPRLGILLYYPAQPNGTAGWRLSSDAPGTTTPGGTLHADWIGGWHDATMDRWINNCIKTKRNCTLGQTGTDRTLRRLNGGLSDSWTGPYFMPIP